MYLIGCLQVRTGVYIIGCLQVRGMYLIGCQQGVGCVVGWVLTVEEGVVFVWVVQVRMGAYLIEC